MEMEYKQLSEIIYPELLTTQKLTSSYVTNSLMLIWKLKLSFVLKDYQVHHVLETPNPCPEDPSWLNADRIARSLIYGRIDQSLYYKFEKSPTAKSFMDSLVSEHEGKIFVQYCLCERYSRLKMDHGGDVNEHMFRMRAVAKLVGFSGVEVDEKVQALMLLDSLPEDWGEDVKRVMMEFHASKEDLSFDNVGRRLRAANEIREWRNFRNNNMEMREGGSKKVKGKTSTSNGDETLSFSFHPVRVVDVIYSDLKTRCQLDYTGSDFRHWKRRIHLVLEGNKVDYLLRDDSPSKEDASSQHKRLSDELTARHIILGGMSDDLFLTFHDYPTARALMDALETWFNSPSIANQMLLFSKYTRCKMLENDPIDHHLLDIDLKVCNLEAVGIEVPDEMQAQRMINSLPKSWSNTQMTLRMDLDDTDHDDKNLKLVDRVRQSVQWSSRLREKMKQREDSESRKRKRSKGECYNCGRPGHYYYNCPS